MASIHKTKRWQKLRLLILQRDLWTCQICGSVLRPGRRHPSSAVVDHKQPYDLRPDLAHDPDNLWAVCFDCHQRECRRIEDRARSMRQWTVAGALWIAQEKAKARVIGLDGRPIGQTPTRNSGNP